MIKRFWRNYNLSIVLAILFLGSWMAHFFVQKSKYIYELHEKGQLFEWRAFMADFWTATLENWQSEFLQLLTFVVLTSFLIHKRSPESKDSEDRAEKKLNEILRILKKR